MPELRRESQEIFEIFQLYSRKTYRSGEAVTELEAVKKMMKYFSYIHVKLIVQVEPRPNCVEAVKKMSSCPACKGLPEVIIIFCFLLKIYFC